MKNKKALYFLLSANAISGIAQGISMLAIPWYFTKIINKPSLFGWIYGITTFLTVFWNLYAGIIIDRYSRKKIFLTLTLIGFFLLTTVSGIGFYQGSIPYYLVALIFCATMFNFNLHYPCLYAFAQEVTEKNNYEIANSMIEIQAQATSVISGSIAAVLLSGLNYKVNFLNFDFNINIKQWSIQKIFLMDGITYLISFMLIIFIRYTPIVKVDIERGSIIKRIKSGIIFLKKRPWIFLFGNASYMVFVVVLVQSFYLLPIYVNNHLKAGSFVYGISELMFAFGSLNAGILIRKIFAKKYLTGIIFLMFVAFFMTLIVSITPMGSGVLIFLLFNLFLGFSNAGIRILRISYLFHKIPNNIIGRVGSIFGIINIILRTSFIMLFSLPFFTISNNIIWAYLILSIFILIFIIPLLIYRNLSYNFFCN